MWMEGHARVCSMPLVSVLFFILTSGQLVTAQTKRLIPGQALELKTLTSADRYRIEANRGDFIHVSMKGSGLRFTLRDLSGRILDQIADADTRRFFTIAAQNGPFFLEVTGSKGSSFQVLLEPPKPADQRARDLVAAWQKLNRGKQAPNSGMTAEQGIALLRQALSVWEKYREPFMNAYTQAELGIALGRLGRHSEAVRYLESAVSGFQAMAEEYLAAICHIHLGQRYASLGFFQKAAIHAEAAIDIAQRLGNLSLKATAYNDLARVQQRLGNFNRTLEMFESANQIWQKLGREDYLAVGLHNLGDYLAHLGKYELARDQFQQAMPKALAQKNKKLLGDLEVATGWTWYRQANYATARTHLKRAASIFEELQDTRNYLVSIERLGIMAFVEGKLAESSAYFGILEANLGKVKSPLERTNYLSSRGFLLLKQGQNEEAEQIGIRVVKAGQALDDDAVVRNGLYLQACARVTKKDYRKALALLNPIVDYLEASRDDVQAFGLRGAFTADRREFYDRYLNLCMDLHRAQPEAGYARKALAFIEKTRGRSLLEGIDTWPDLTRGDGHRLSQLDAEIALKEQARLRLPKAEREGVAGAQISRDVRALLHEHDRLRFKLENAGGKAKPKGSRLDLAQSYRSFLDAQTLLLVYALTERESYLWIIDQTSTKTAVLPGEAVIRKRVADYYHKVSKPPSRLGRQPQLLAEHHLAETLLRPLTGLDLRGKTRILFMNDGIVSRVPFGALRIPGQPERLAERFEWVIIPSVSVLEERRRAYATRPVAPRAIGVVANPVFHSMDARIHRGQRTQGNRSSESWRQSVLDLDSLRPLPATAKESTAILEVFKGQSLWSATGFDANLTTLRNHDLSAYRMLHFATHGLPNEDHPELAGLVLSLVNRDGKSIPGLLQMNAIQDLRLNADLVVLSACKTAGETELAGEGLVGLSHGFLKAGARSVIVSLWNVNDRATAVLMERFYRGLVERRLTPAAALRAAQNAMSREVPYGEPFYWAGFVLMGEYRPE